MERQQQTSYVEANEPNTANFVKNLSLYRLSGEINQKQIYPIKK